MPGLFSLSSSSTFHINVVFTSRKQLKCYQNPFDVKCVTFGNINHRVNTDNKGHKECESCTYVYSALKNGPIAQ